MNGAKSFKEILKKKLENPRRASSKQNLSDAEPVWSADWQIERPRLKPSNPYFAQSKSNRPKTKINLNLRGSASQIQDSVTQNPPPTRPARPRKLKVLLISDLGVDRLLHLELLVRGGWLPRKEVYEWDQWQSQRRRAVRTTHPDLCKDPQLTSQFREVHEAFVQLKDCFIEVDYGSESAWVEAHLHPVAS